MLNDSSCLAALTTIFERNPSRQNIFKLEHPLSLRDIRDKERMSIKMYKKSHCRVYWYIGKTYSLISTIAILNADNNVKKFSDFI